ncbi:MAG: ABC transporter permease [Propionibacteriaceae bacterium]|jgi:ABC-2 type transport system permease protein|nr:ABC transporter permease [Propionibacteriaceae bacterium]
METTVTAVGARTAAELRAARLATLPLVDMNPPEGFFRGAIHDWADIWVHRELLGQLMSREIKTRYKGSMLGMLWSFIKPLVMLLVYYVAVGQFLGAAKGIPGFGLYIFSGLSVWVLFSEIVQVSSMSILANAAIIKKIHLPREVFPLASLGPAVMNFTIQISLALVVGVFTGSITGRSLVVHLPLSVLVALVWAVALGLIVAAANVYFRDVGYLVEVGLMLGFWSLPVVYSWTMVSGKIGTVLQEIYLSNPITMAVMGIQKAIWGGNTTASYFPSHLGPRMLVALLVGLVALFCAQRVFSRLQADFAQEV